MTLDGFDRAILRIVQKDNQVTHADIGKDIGLSASAVRRRLKILRDNDVIIRDVSLVRPESLGVRLIVTLSFGDESLAVYDAFDALILETPEILQGYHVAGSNDYVLIVHGSSLEWYEEWGKQIFMSNPAV